MKNCNPHVFYDPNHVLSIREFTCIKTPQKNIARNITEFIRHKRASDYLAKIWNNCKKKNPYEKLK